jgi:thiol:disulfide interchange protein DsbA
MKPISFLLALFALAMAGCSQDPAPQQAPEPDNAVVEDIERPETPAEPADDEDDAESVMVEESAGDVAPTEADDQPIILARADTSGTAAEQDWKFTEGQHFTRMVPAQPTVGGADKIEVAEFFWYGCNHCFDFEPYLNRWSEDLPPNVRFVRVPALWNPLVRIHGQLYYTEEVLANNGKLADRDGFRQAVFLEIHRRGNRLASESAIYEVFERFGVSEADFKNTWNSFEVAQKLRVADDLARRYGLASVPLIVVNGKYKTSGAEAGSYPTLLEVMDELIAREESIR